MRNLWQLNSDLDWREIWNLVFPDRDPGVYSAALPILINCPWCYTPGARRTCLICRDPVLGGQHFWCAECQRSGDMLQFAAGGWKLEISAAIARLRQSGLTQLPGRADELTGYGELVRERERMRQLLEQHPLALSAPQHNARRLAWKLFRLSYWPEAERGRKIFSGMAATTATAVEAALQPLAMEWSRCYPQERYQRSGSRGRIFRGRHWQEILAIPAWDLPGRVAALWCLGRDDLSEQDRVWGLVHYELQSPDGGIRRLGHTGLVYHPEVLRAVEHYAGRYVVLSDVEQVVRRQVQQLLHADQPLPLVGLPQHVRYGPGEHAWQLFWRDEPTFVTEELLALETAWAIRLNGKIAWLRDAFAIGDTEFPVEPERWLETCWTRARPWGETLSIWIEQADDVAVSNLLWNLSLYGVRPQDILFQLSTRARDIAQDCLGRLQPQALTTTTVLIDRQLIQETPQGWFLQGPRGLEQICNARLRIDRVVCYADQQSSVYWGRILLENNEFVFCADKREFDRDPFRWMENYLLQQGADWLVYNPRWSSRALLIARQIQPPQTCRGLERVGWSAQLQEFSLPHVRLFRDGRYLARQINPYPDRAPGEGLFTPVSDHCSLKDQWRPGLLLLSAVLADLLTELVGLEPRGGRIFGTRLKPVWEWLSVCLGNRCHRKLFRDEKRLKLTSEVHSELEFHAWPVLVGGIPGELSADAQLWLRRQAPGWLICAQDSLACRLAELEGFRWTFAVPEDFPATWTSSEQHQFSQLTILALSRCLKQTVELPTDWAQLRRCCGQALQELTGVDLTDPPGEPVLLAVIRDLLRQGLLTAGREGWCSPETGLLLGSAGEIYLQPSALQTACSRARQAPLDLDRVWNACRKQQFFLSAANQGWKLPLEARHLLSEGNW